MRYLLSEQSLPRQNLPLLSLYFLFQQVKLIVRHPEWLQIIMVLKRNTRQITFLHVYHHSSIALIWWIIAYHAPGGEGRTDCCNCCIAAMEALFVGR
jgi:hypothetical protein